jgi:hypothetical protein
MKTRTLSIELASLFSNELSIELCNALGYAIADKTLLTLDAQGKAEVELTVLEKNSTNFYRLEAKGAKQLFWLYEGDETIALEETFKRKQYESYNEEPTEECMNIINFNDVINRYLNSEEIVTEEDKMLLRDYLEHVEVKASNDKRICEIDEGVVNVLR